MHNVRDYIDELISEVRESTCTPDEKALIVHYLSLVYEWSFIHDLNNRHN